jgi:hypothetical protein
MRSIALVTLLILAGCTPRIVAQTPGSIVFGDVERDINSGQVFEMAQAHCQQSGRNAKLVSDQARDGYQTYECIE